MKNIKRNKQREKKKRSRQRKEEKKIKTSERVFEIYSAREREESGLSIYSFRTEESMQFIDTIYLCFDD